MLNKIQIRTDMRAFLANLSEHDRHQRSLAACQQLASTREFKSAQMIMLFLSMPTEIETSTLALKAWAEGKSIAVPRVDWESRRMEPVEIKSLDVSMRRAGPGGNIREPINGTVVPLDLIDMIVIPGLAFDRRGFRVGRGRGFYDRFLAQQDFGGSRCALCFHEQIVPHVPAEEHDVPMDLVVTDRDVIHVGANTPCGRR